MMRHRRYGVAIDCDEACLAWRSGDIDRMRKALILPTNAVDRHHLLHTLAESLLQASQDRPELLDEAVSVARLHVDELEHLLPELALEEQISTLRLWERARAMGRPGPWLVQEKPLVLHYQYGIGSFGWLEEGLRRLGRHAEADQVKHHPAAIKYFNGRMAQSAND